MTDAANKYIVSLSPYVMNDRDTHQQNALLKALICYERIGDLAVNISEEADLIHANGKQFSANAMAELRIAFDAVYEILDITTRSYIDKNPVLAAKVEPLEEVIDDLVEDMNARHVYRMVNRLCDAVNGIYYQSILTNIEHLSDKCSDLAIYVLEGSNEDIFGQEHSFVHALHHSNDEEYMRAYQEEYAKYVKALSAVSVTDAIEVPVYKEEKEAKEEKPKKDRSFRKKAQK